MLHLHRRVADNLIFEKTYLIVLKDETGLKFKINVSTLFLMARSHKIGSIIKKWGDNAMFAKNGNMKYGF